jgi:hypothetical protein
MRWPRGRYNGKRIIGFAVHVRVRVTHWWLAAEWNYGNPYLAVGPIRIGVECEYDY